MLRTLFRFNEINLGFVTSARGTGHLTPKKSIVRGHLTKERACMVGTLTKKNKKMSNAWGSARGWGGVAWAPLELTHT